MNRFKRITTAVGLSVIMIISMTITGFADQIVYEKVEDEVISNGVTYKNILRFGKNGWLNLNAVYIDLRDTGIELDVLMSSSGLSTKEPLSAMVENTGNVVSAINGDFFYMLSPDSPLGAIIKNGEVISTPITVHDYATFFIDDTGEAFVDYWGKEYWKDELYATTSSGINIPISAINKYTDGFQYIMLIDRNWGTHSPGFNAGLQDMVEVVVIDDIVVEIRQGQPSVEIPEDGYILLASKGKSAWGQSDLLLSGVEVGDGITINKNIRPDLENIKLAFGGGTILVKDGQVVSFTQNVSGAHPRTAIGITWDRSKLIFVTIDGRHTSYTGVDGEQLAEIMIELGSRDAIMMDGGGSTTMMKRGQGEFEPKVINHPSDGTERKIINGVAVISTAVPGRLKGIKVEVDDEKSFVGVPRKIDVKAFDNNYNPLGVDYSRVNLSLKSGRGTFNGMNFIPAEPGKAVICAEYFGITSEVTLSVSEDLSGDVGADKLNRPYEIEGEKLFVHGGIKPQNYTLLDKIAINKIGSLINNNYDLSLFTGDIDLRLSDNIEGQMISAKSGYGSVEQGDSLIIKLDNSKDGIRQTDFAQWPWLQNLINTTSKKNIFVVMSKPIFGSGGFTDKLEADLLADTLASLSEKGKRVFVFYEGRDISVDMIDGVRYISTGIYNSDVSKDPREIFKYIEFNIGDKEVTYQIKSLFE